MPENHQYRHGLAVMRAQPLHIGHEQVIRDKIRQGHDYSRFDSGTGNGTQSVQLYGTQADDKKRVRCRN